MAMTMLFLARSWRTSCKGWSRGVNQAVGRRRWRHAAAQLQRRAGRPSKPMHGGRAAPPNRSRGCPPSPPKSTHPDSWRASKLGGAACCCSGLGEERVAVQLGWRCAWQRAMGAGRGHSWTWFAAARQQGWGGGDEPCMIAAASPFLCSSISMPTSSSTVRCSHITCAGLAGAASHHPISASKSAADTAAAASRPSPPWCGSAAPDVTPAPTAPIVASAFTADAATRTPRRRPLVRRSPESRLNRTHAQPQRKEAGPQGQTGKTVRTAPSGSSAG